MRAASIGSPCQTWSKHRAAASLWRFRSGQTLLPRRILGIGGGKDFDDLAVTSQHNRPPSPAGRGARRRRGPEELLDTLQESNAREAFLEAAGDLGGRWVLIVDDGAEVRLLHDPMGLRQVFYTDRKACGALWCASQPAPLAEVLGLELFEWEHWAGNFAAMGQSEWDIVQEAFTPYNCRRLLETMLSVDPRHRHHEKPRLCRRLIRRLWPETLSEPINAPPGGPIAPVLAVALALGISRLLPETWKRSAKRGLSRLLESP